MPSFFIFRCFFPLISHTNLCYVFHTCISLLSLLCFCISLNPCTSPLFFFFISQKCATAWGFGFLFRSSDQFPVEFRFSSSPPLPFLMEFFLPSGSFYVSMCPMRLCRCVGRFQSVQYCFLWPMWDGGLYTAVFFSFFSPFQASLGTPSNSADHYRIHFSWVTWCHLPVLSCWHGDEQNSGDVCTACGSCLDSAPSSKQSQQVCGHNSFWSSK